MSIELDPEQRSAALRLDQLRDQLNREEHSLAQRLRHRLRYRLPWPDAGDGHAGLYLWGAVGRGKTLVDGFAFYRLAASRRGVSERISTVSCVRSMRRTGEATKQRN